jgi:AmiR/NasT family two-component response regulator
MSKSSISNEWFEMSYENSIIYVTYFAVVIDENILKEINKSFYLLTNGVPSAILVDGRKVVEWTRDARKWQIENEDARQKKVVAMVIGSPVQKIILNFFMILNKPAVPIKIFTNKEDALDWLKRF